MNYIQMTRALEIFTAYQPDPSQQSISATHDQVFAGPEPSTVSEAHVAELDGLGWHVDYGNECFWSWA